MEEGENSPENSMRPRTEMGWGWKESAEHGGAQDLHVAIHIHTAWRRRSKFLTREGWLSRHY